MKVFKTTLLLAVCFVLLFATVARADEKLLAPIKNEVLKIMAKMQTLEATQIKAMNAAPKGSEAYDLAFRAYEQTVKLRIHLQDLWGVTYADLMERALKGLVKEVQRVQKTGNLQEQQKLINQLEQLKQ